MPPISRLARAAARLLPLALLLATVPQAQPARPDAAARLAQALNLSPDQQARLRASAERHLGQPGGSWALAAEAARVLSPEQLTQLRERADRPAERRGERARQGRPGARADGARPDGRRRADRPMTGARAEGRRAESRRAEGRRAEGRAALSDTQRSALRETMTAARERRTALVGQLRAGTISDDAFLAESRRLREQAAADVARIAPDAPRRDPAAAGAARMAALGLTAAQQRQLDQIRLDAIRQAPTRDRAARPTEAEREARRAAMQAQRARAEAVYTPEQRAVLDVHRALARATRGGRPARVGATTE